MVKNRNEVCLERSNVQNAEREENYFGDSSSIFSEEASNYPEEEEDFLSNIRATFQRTRKPSKKYQSRNPKLSKKKSKTNIDKKMRILQRLIPNSSNVDNACVLDEAILYIKILQNQLQFILSANATRMYMSRMQTLFQPNMTHQFYGSSVFQTDILLPSLVGSRIQMPATAGMMFNNHQHPSLLSFPSYGSLMMPFQE